MFVGFRDVVRLPWALLEATAAVTGDRQLDVYRSCTAAVRHGTQVASIEEYVRHSPQKCSLVDLMTRASNLDLPCECSRDREDKSSDLAPAAHRLKGAVTR